MLYVHKTLLLNFRKLRNFFETKIGIYAALNIYTDINFLYIDSIKPSEYIFLFSYKFRDHNQTSLF